MKLGRRTRIALYSTTALLWTSGAAIWWLATAAAESAEPSPWTPRLLALHGGVALLFLLVLGSLLSGHVRRGWRLRRNRPTGVITLTAGGLLTLTGWALYYAGGERLRALSRSLHDTIGLALPLLLLVHLLAGRRRSSPPA